MHSVAGTPRLAEERERAQDDVRALHARHAPRPADEEALVADAHHPAGLGARLRALGHAALELDPEADDRELRGGRDAEGDELVAHLRADGDERVGDAREHPLEHPEDERPEPAEVPAQHVAVERVHDDRRARAAGEQRSRRGRPRRPSRCACAGSSARSARIIRARRMVASRSCTGEISRCRCGIVTTWTPRLVGDVGHRLLAVADRAGDERRVVAALGEALGQVRDVERGPAHVQPRDHAEDADRGQTRNSAVRRRPSSSPTVRLPAERLAGGGDVRPRVRGCRPRAAAPPAGRPPCRG